MKQATIENVNGMRLSAINYGCAMTDLTAPDRDGNMETVIFEICRAVRLLTKSRLRRLGRRPHRRSNPKRGNRRVRLDPKRGAPSYHGGHDGITARYWDMDVDGQCITFTYLSPDGEEGVSWERPLQSRLRIDGRQRAHRDDDGDDRCRHMGQLKTIIITSTSGDARRFTTIG